MKKKLKKSLVSGMILTGLIVSGITLMNNVSATELNDQSVYHPLNRGFGYEQMLETKADILDISVDELKKELESKTLREVFDENGISQDEVQQKMQEKNMERWKARGLSEDEIQKRIEWRKEKHAGSGTNCQFNRLSRMKHNAGFRK